ncbi:MAG: dTDP-4-dehydrorhamnose 3,5-epimerase [bacterium]|nr:dTDP-4-dehydrorhamnose 3,5-epimerase [bacterium]
MGFRIESRHLGEITVVQPDVYEDARGFFVEVFRTDRFAELGLPAEFVQDNHSRSGRGVLRGLHFQYDPKMSKVMRVTQGAAWLVAVDIRPGSPTLGGWYGREVSAENKLQIWAPPGFARGFCVLSETAEIQYKCTAVYNKDGEGGIRWDDPALGIDWPVTDPLLSEKDTAAPTLAEWLERPEAQHFKF